MSSVLSEALRRARQAEAWACVRDELLEGQPPISAADIEATEREWKR